MINDNAKHGASWACFAVFRRTTLRPPVVWQPLRQCAPCPVLCTSPAARGIAADPAMGKKKQYLVIAYCQYQWYIAHVYSLILVRVLDMID